MIGTSIADDRILCTILCCENGLISSRLKYYLYLLQEIGIDLNLRFKVLSTGMGSSDVAEMSTELVSEGIILVDNGSFSVAIDAEEYFDNTLFTLKECDAINYVMSVANRLTVPELDLLCVSDILISRTLSSMPADKLVASRVVLESTLERLCSAYSEENFNHCIRIIENIRDERLGK